MRSWGLNYVDALSAYHFSKVTGRDMIAAVIDTGIDMSHPEFKGRVSASSVDVTGAGRGPGDVDGHGTAVAGILAAARDDIGIHGVAFDSTVLAIRVDMPGSCEADGGSACTFTDSHLAAGIDHARQSGARVINLSLGGDRSPNDGLSETFAALRRATQAGLLIVIAAGNAEEGRPAGASSGFPGNFVLDPGSLGRVVVVGSISDDHELSDFSNRAGDLKDFYLLAPGGNIPTTYVDGGYVRVWGTSFAAPFVSGALLLMLQAFPHLAPEDALEILLVTALNYGPWSDAEIYGRGAIAMNAAFQPVGASSVAMGGATGQSVSVGALAIPPSGASGDWLWESGFIDGAVLRDGYDRAFRFDPAPSDVRGDGGLGALETAARAGLARQSATHAGPASVHMRVTPERTRALRNMPEEVYQDRPDVSFRFTHGAATIEAGRGFAAPGPLPGAGVAVLSETRFSGAVANLTGSRDWATVRYRFGDAAVSFRTAESDLGGVSAAAASWDFGRHQIALEVGEGREDFAALGGRIAGRFGMDDQSRNSFAAALWSGELGLGWRGAARFEQARADIALPAWMGVEDQVAATAWS
ncbi:S8 family serine peptidase, partial [Glycocaulis profundi]